MLQILGVSGSLRKNSFNTALLNAAAAAAGESARIDVVTLHGIPLYDGDLEAEKGLPAAVKELKDRIAASDALLFATPEYNHGIPGVFKNAIDWLSRPPDDIPRVFHGRLVGLIGATPGGFGTMMAQTAWLPVLRTLRMRPWFGGRLMLGGAGKLFSADGTLDAETAKRVAEFVEEFAAFATAASRA